MPEDAEDTGERNSSNASRRGLLKTAGLVAVTGSLVRSTRTIAAQRDGDADLDSLVGEMTLEEKVRRTHGVDGGPEGIAGYLSGIERLDIPGMGMADGPPGASLGEPTTAFPHPITAAATWNPSLVRAQGAAIAREAKSGDVSVLLGPSVDTFRAPLHSRSGETYGEDPHLAATMAREYAGAVQSEGVVATAKHYVCYNQTSTTGDVDDYFSTSEHDVVVGERPLREIYYPPFKAAVTEGGAGAVMTAYNRVNGTFASENGEILRDTLKDEWDFDGFVVSDWFGTHSTVRSAVNGLDVEMPSARFFGDALREAVENGEVDEAVVDEMVGRTLNAQREIGALSGERVGSAPERGTEDHFELARRIAEEGAVLLKNERDHLPFDAEELDELAVVGPDPTSFKPSVGGSDHVDAIRRVGPVEGIDSLVGDDVTVTTASSDRTRLVEADALSPTSGEGSGLTAEYFDGDDWSGAPVLTRVEERVNLTEEDLDEFDAESVSVRWTGTLSPPSSGAYGFALTSQGASTLYVDGDAIIENEGGGFFGPKTERAALELDGDEAYDVRVEATGGAPVHLEWNPPEAIRESAAVAAAADAAVVLARTDTFYGDDRMEFGLPGNQNALVEAVGEANDDTTVVLNTEAPVAMPWVADVPAILQVWFLGQEGGHALANLLFGETNPSGKTPVTFGNTLDDYLPQETATLPDDARGYPGVDGTVYYDEGVFVGYRHFDERDIEPLFPFGHGESYTDFAYSNLRVTPKVKNGKKGTTEAKLRVTNTGDRPGAEVVQLYVGDVEADVERPPKELKAFRKVRLAPGEKTTVRFELGEDAFSFYHPEKEAWTAEPGRFDVLVGSSSRDIRTRESIERIDPRGDREKAKKPGSRKSDGDD